MGEVLRANEVWTLGAGTQAQLRIVGDAQVQRQHFEVLRRQIDALADVMFGDDVEMPAQPGTATRQPPTPREVEVLAEKIMRESGPFTAYELAKRHGIPEASITRAQEGEIRKVLSNIGYHGRRDAHATAPAPALRTGKPDLTPKAIEASADRAAADGVPFTLRRLLADMGGPKAWRDRALRREAKRALLAAGFVFQRSPIWHWRHDAPSAAESEIPAQPLL